MQTFLVTGGNTGIGRATAEGLAAGGGRVYLACRSAAKGEEAAAAIRAATGSSSVSVLPLDLADLDSVRSGAAAFLALGEPLNVLVNNAGVAGVHGLTRQGFELMFGVNHLGHFLLTSLLLEHLTASAPARVVTVASDAHYSARGIDFAALRRRARHVTGLPEYAVSKLCNVLFSQELARRTAGYRGDHVRPASRGGRLGHVAAGAVAGAAAGHAADDVGDRWRRDVAVLRDLAGGGAGQRAVLRQVRGAAREFGGYAGAWR